VLRLELLGTPTVALDGVPAVFDTRKSVALLALLAVARRPQSRDTLAAMLWPESDDARSRSSLRRTLSVTAAAVGNALRTSRTTIELDPALVTCDVWEFERLARQGDSQSMSSAAALYRDDFLSGFRARAGAEFDHWQQLVAEDQRQRLSGLLEALVEMESRSSDLGTALVHARRWLVLDELHEPAQRAIMRILAWSGQRSSALEQYRRCVRVLDEELGVEPLEDTTALYEAILANRLPPPVPSATGRRPPAPAEPSEPPTSTPPDLAPAGTAQTAPLPAQQEVLASLAAERARAQAGGRIAVVAGPSGFGKSWIVEAFRRRVSSDVPWIVARCREAERTLELGCVTDLLRSAFECRPDVLEHASPSDAREVARLVPDLTGGHDPALPPLESPGAQVRFFRSVGATIAAAGSGRDPGVVLVEDVEHVDDTSARLLAFLLRRLGDLNALVLLTWQQDVDLPEVLLEAIGEAGLGGRLVRHDLRPFERGDLEAILDARGAHNVDVDAFLDQTGGLPLLVMAYADALAGENTSAGVDAEGDARPRGSVPTTARHLFADRLSRVSQTTTQVLSAAAVIGTVFDAELLRATSGRSPSEVADALDEALSRDLLVERTASPASHGYEFRYEGLRQFAYDSCGAARRRLLHGRAADALARRAGSTASGVRYAAVADHLAEAGRTGEAADWSWRAAQRATALFAHAEALDHLRQSLELGHPAAEAHRAIADALVALGRYREACVELEKAAASPEGLAPGGPESALFAAEIEHRLAAVHGRLGNWPVAGAHLDAAADLCPTGAVVRIRIEADRAFVAFQCGDADAERLALRALEHAQESGDSRALAQAYNVAGMLVAAAGEFERADSLLRASLDVANRDDDPAASVAAFNNLAKVLHDAGRTGDAINAAETALRRGIEHGDVHRIAALHSNLADLLHAMGRSDESVAHLKEAAAGFASVDAGDEANPGVWTLTRW
jgi:DNA-binding SARP family transcriptional activator/tetratricopeptide (TPR) repeat protein